MYISAIPNYNYAYKNNTVRNTAFCSGEKFFNDKAGGVTNKLASQVHDDAQKTEKKLLYILNRHLGKYVASQSNPNGIIAPKGIKSRVKSAYSIVEKTGSRQLKSKEEIKKMGDLIGARIILRRGTKTDGNKIIDVLTSLVNSGELTITEIENYRPAETLSYASGQALDKLEAACNKRLGGIRRTDSSMPSGYTAIHLTVKIDDYIGEIQIMGCDVEELKELEDFIYKLRNNKSLEPKYASIEKVLKNALAKIPEEYQPMYSKYVKDSYSQARELEPHPISKRSKPNFLPIPYFLPKELDFAEIAKMKERIDRLS